MNRKLLTIFSPLALLAASCGGTASGDSPRVLSKIEGSFAITELGSFAEPWAMAFAPGTSMLFITEKAGTIKMQDVKTGKTGTVTGAPKVDYGGQGGLGDIAFLPSETSPTITQRTIFLTWAEAGPNDTRGAAVGRGTLTCDSADACQISGLEVIWRQTPKVTGRGHYSHRLAFSPDGKHLFIASGERQKMQPAQDPASDLGKIIRLPIDAAGKPAGPAERYSLGHRNILALAFAPDGRLWDLEHGPAGGDELNLVRQGANYGWPLVSEGRHYDGAFIPHHDTRPDFAAPAIYWNPVIAPGGMTFYSGKMWPEWRGEVLIGAMSPTAIVRVRIDGDKASEQARYPMARRIRAITEDRDGSLLVLEDKEGGRLLRLSRK
jgi:glucose/arabinose dehydrogenase